MSCMINVESETANLDMTWFAKSNLSSVPLIYLHLSSLTLGNNTSIVENLSEDTRFTRAVD